MPEVERGNEFDEDSKKELWWTFVNKYILRNKGVGESFIGTFFFGILTVYKQYHVDGQNITNEVINKIDTIRA